MATMWLWNQSASHVAVTVRLLLSGLGFIFLTRFITSHQVPPFFFSFHETVFTKLLYLSDEVRMQ